MKAAIQQIAERKMIKPGTLVKMWLAEKIEQELPCPELTGEGSRVNH
jgi:hypothetical protein